MKKKKKEKQMANNEKKFKVIPKTVPRPVVPWVKAGMSYVQWFELQKNAHLKAKEN